MSDTNDKDKNEDAKGARTLSVSRTTVEQSRVRQNFSHGRSKTVVVETKRKRILGTPGAPVAAGGAAVKAPAAPTPATPTAAPKPLVVEKKTTAPKPAARKPAAKLGKLTSSEQQARERALAGAKVRDVEEAAQRKISDEMAAVRAAEEAQANAIRDAEEARSAQDSARKKAIEDKKVETATQSVQSTAPTKDVADSKARKPKKENKPAQQPTTRPARGGNERRRGKLTIGNALAGDQERKRSVAAFKRRMQRQKKQAAGIHDAPGEKRSREVIIPEVITIQELANRMAERAVDIIKELMKQGQMMQINDIIDTDTAQLIAEEFGHTVKRVSESDVEEGILGDEDDDEDMVPRAPVVTVMGHVDHGKTSLLDALRKTNVVSGEAGGITQHIGAYQVETGKGIVTFLDTPGHAAFTSMRARGAQATDIVILVVAADDGVMPQTIEAINHAKEAGVPIIVAINKIDVEGADPTRVRTELLSHEIVVESMGGGDVLDVEVSATKGTNLDKLLDAILLQAEILELKANPDRPADGMVVEAQLDRGRGAVATMLVKRGTLKIGNIIVAGSAWGKVRAIINDKGEHVAEAGPSNPVEVLGLNSPPEAGDQLVVVETEARAREITDYRIRKRRESRGAATSALTLEQMMNELKKADRKEVSILLKADVQGSAEAIVQALDKLSTDEVIARVIHYAAGGINESDIELAKASGAVIFGFNVRANKQARELATQTGREIRYYNVIYDLIDDVKSAMSGMLDPTLRETFLGNAEILEVFNVSKIGKVAGCRITEGKVARGASVRLIRDNVVVHEGKLSTLKRFKDEVKEVVGGQECGMAFENYQDMRAGDVIECFTVESIDRTIDELLEN